MALLAGCPLTICWLGATSSDANSALLSVAAYQARQLRAGMSGGGRPSGSHSSGGLPAAPVGSLEGHVMIMQGGLGAARGPLAGFSSRDWVRDYFGGFTIIAGGEQYRRKLTIELPLGSEYMEEFKSGQFRQQLTASEDAAVQDFKRRVAALRAEGLCVSVLLLELVTADTMEGFSGIFLQHLQVGCGHRTCPF